MWKFPHLWRSDGVAGGQVCLARTGIIATFLAERFAAGDTIEAIARDYGQPVEKVEDAIRCVVYGTIGRFGIRRAIERQMESVVPLESLDA